LAAFVLSNENSKRYRYMTASSMLTLAQAAADAAAAADGVETANFRPTMWYVAPIASILALGFAVYFYRKMMAANEGNATMREIAQHVREGAMAYLRRQYMVVVAVFIVLVAILGALAYWEDSFPDCAATSACGRRRMLPRERPRAAAKV
jgi:hypothetical protein